MCRLELFWKISHLFTLHSSQSTSFSKHTANSWVLSQVAKTHSASMSWQALAIFIFFANSLITISILYTYGIIQTTCWSYFFIQIWSNTTTGTYYHYSLINARRHWKHDTYSEHFPLLLVQITYYTIFYSLVCTQSYQLL